MNLPTFVRIPPARLFVAALSLLCIPIMAQNVIPAPAPAAGVTAAPASAPEPTIATPASGAPLVATPAPAAAVTPAPAATVTAAPGTVAPTTTATPDHSQMNTTQIAMTENMAKMEAAGVARRANEDSEQAGNKSDMEMKHAMIAQLQAMSDQIKELDGRITALSAQLEAATAKPPVKAKPAKPAVRPPIKPVFNNQ